VATIFSRFCGIPAAETIATSTWVALAGHEGWAVLMKDKRIRYRPAERACRHRLQPPGDEDAERMADQVGVHAQRLLRVVAAVVQQPPTKA
jgi:hypothetical protein